MATKILREDLLDLEKEKGGICISIIVPIHNLFHERRNNPIIIDKAVQRAKEYLYHNYELKEIESLAGALDKLKNIEFNRNVDINGIGFFVSENIAKAVPLFFPVKEKVIIDKSFEIRDLLFEAQYSRPYFVLHLSMKGARLYDGRLNRLREIFDDNFPMEYKDDYEYSHPSRASSFSGSALTKAYEKDKSQLEAVRYTLFQSNVDKKLNSYLSGDTLLVIAGVMENINGFVKVTAHTDNIAGNVTGNYTHLPESELANDTWKIVKEHLDKAKNEVILEFEDKIGHGYGVTGIKNIWKAIKDGRGDKLLIEKDYSVPGFLVKDDEYNLLMSPPKAPHMILTDVVDDLIEMMADKNGEIILTDNNTLSDYHCIALITRY